jgi:DNA polymerase III subunit epsilon
VQLSFDAADRLVELIEARRGPVPADEAARSLFALASAPTAIARSLLDDVVTGDARLAWRGGRLVGLAESAETRTQLDAAAFVVFDLETTGLRPGSSRICEIGAQRVESLELAATFESLVDPGVPLPAPIAALTGIQPRALRGAPRVDHVVRRFLAFADGGVLVAHNARFDLGFLDREVERLTGKRVAGAVVDTVWLARRLLEGRLRRVGLHELAHFFGVPTRPCHRALPDARATAEVLLHLVGLAQERGARTVSDLVELSAPRARRLHAKRGLVAGAPTGPGVYLFRDAHGGALYVGRARSLRPRLRSYFAGGRQRPAVEAALSALAAVDWEETGSELEAALRELRMLRELRPVANARGTRPDRHVFLERRDARWRVTSEPGPFGPLRSRRLASAAARALDGHEHDDPAAAVPVLRAKLRRVARDQRFEDAARLRDRLHALESVVETLAELGRARSLEACVLAPGRPSGVTRAFFVTRGRIACERLLPRGGGALVEARAGLTEARRASLSLAPADVDELLLVASFLRRPPPELSVAPFDAVSIAAAVEGVPLAA